MHVSVAAGSASFRFGNDTLAVLESLKTVVVDDEASKGIGSDVVWFMTRLMFHLAMLSADFPENFYQQYERSL
jgi:hypothetical protein